MASNITANKLPASTSLVKYGHAVLVNFWKPNPIIFLSIRLALQVKEPFPRMERRKKMLGCWFQVIKIWQTLTLKTFWIQFCHLGIPLLLFFFKQTFWSLLKKMSLYHINFKGIHHGQTTIVDPVGFGHACYWIWCHSIAKRSW